MTRGTIDPDKITAQVIEQIKLEGGNSPAPAVNFPTKLFEILEPDESSQWGDRPIISWDRSGQFVRITKNRELLVDFLKIYGFKQTQKDSFLRQLNYYGFKRIKSGDGKGGYYHENFCRGHPELLVHVTCTRFRYPTFKKAKAAASSMKKAKKSPMPQDGPDARAFVQGKTKEAPKSVRRSTQTYKKICTPRVIAALKKFKVASRPEKPVPSESKSLPFHVGLVSAKSAWSSNGSPDAKASVPSKKPNDPKGMLDNPVPMTGTDSNEANQLWPFAYVEFLPSATGIEEVALQWKDHPADLCLPHTTEIPPCVDSLLDNVPSDPKDDNEAEMQEPGHSSNWELVPLADSSRSLVLPVTPQTNNDIRHPGSGEFKESSLLVHGTFEEEDSEPLPWQETNDPLSFPSYAPQNGPTKTFPFNSEVGKMLSSQRGKAWFDSPVATGAWEVTDHIPVVVTPEKQSFLSEPTVPVAPPPLSGEGNFAKASSLVSDSGTTTGAQDKRISLISAFHQRDSGYYQRLLNLGTMEEPHSTFKFRLKERAVGGILSHDNVSLGEFFEENVRTLENSAKGTVIMFGHESCRFDRDTFAGGARAHAHPGHRLSIACNSSTLRDSTHSTTDHMDNESSFSFPESSFFFPMIDSESNLFERMTDGEDVVAGDAHIDALLSTESSDGFALGTIVNSPNDSDHSDTSVTSESLTWDDHHQIGIRIIHPGYFH